MNSGGKKDYRPEELGSIVGPIAKTHNITAVSIFGSRARGDHSSSSDYDFLIDTNTDFDYHDYCSFIEAMESILGASIDIVNRSTLKEDRFSIAVRKEEIRVW